MGGLVAVGLNMGVRNVEESLPNFRGIVGLLRAEVGPRECKGDPRPDQVKRIACELYLL